MLERLDVLYDLAVNGQEAVDAVTASPTKYDIILLDSHMPVMNGDQATQRIREFEAKSGSKHNIIVAVTADAMSGAADKYIACGMDAYVAKPIELAVLRDLLARFHVLIKV